jgi:hypothetical protein
VGWKVEAREQLFQPPQAPITDLEIARWGRAEAGKQLTGPPNRGKN